MRHHIEIYVSDLDRSAAFWTPLMQQLGYEADPWSGGMNYVKEGQADLYFLPTPAKHPSNSDAKAAVHTGLFAANVERAGDDGLLMQAYASLLSQLAEMPEFLQRSASALSASRLKQMPAQEKFPLIEHLWHIRDCDVDLYAHRIRLVLQRDKPALEPVDVGAWYEERHYKDRDGPTAIAEFAALRTNLIAELEPLNADALARTGVRADGSSINILGLIEQLLDHDRDHRWRIARILSEFDSAP